MYLVDDVDNEEMLKKIVLGTCEGLKVSKKRVNMNHYGNM